MVQESVAILAICSLLVFGFFRTKHLGYAIAALPITFIPIGYLFARGVLYLLKDTFFGVRYGVAMGFANLLAIIVTCVVIGLISRKVENKTKRRLYLMVMILYSLVLGWAYIFESISPLLADF